MADTNESPTLFELAIGQCLSDIEKGRPYVVFSSFGNDSVALVQWAHERGLTNVHVAYSNTGWCAPYWPRRVARGKVWVRSLGFEFSEIPSEGFKTLCRRKRTFPRQGMQFCTLELKINPALRWLDETDPAKEATILIGVRRAESSNRRDYPYFTESSPNHGGRPRVAPMADYSDDDRNELIIRAGWEPLPHRSKECYPCINSKKEDLLELEKDHERVEEVAAFESEMGFSAKGQPIRLFKPYRYMGATGIREMLKWAKSPRGKYLPPVDLDDGTGGANEDGCVSEWCGI